ncbi:MAG: hypothetical protein R8M46_07760 [Ghiorsea sp.]
MLKLRIFCILFLALVLAKPAFSLEESSLDRLILLHDILPQEDLQLDSELRSSPKLVQKQPKRKVSLKNLQAPIRVLIDVRSNHSDGSHDFGQLVELAKKRHIQALAFTEHDRYSIRFGLDPVPHLLGYSQEHPSLYTTGLDQFFDDLTNIQKQQPLTLFAGTESTPGYHWQGIPFKNLSLHNAERHLITLGAKEAKQIKGLTSYSLIHGYGSKEISIMFWFIFVFILMYTLIRKRKRSVALLLAGSYIAFMTTWLMKPIPNPDEDFIRSAHEQNLFALWTHPGTLSGVREGPMGVLLSTLPYNNEVFKSFTADAFAAVYGDTDQNTVPAGLWDQYMMDYLNGYLPKPIWAVAAGDYHGEGQANEYLGNFPMDVWAKSAQEDDILNALKQGRMASWHMGKDVNLSLNALFLEYTDSDTGERKRLHSGDESVVSADIQLITSIRDMDSKTKPINLKGQWIVDGNIAAYANLSTADPNTVEATSLHLSVGRHVIRFQIPYQHGIRLETNPFLVQVRK